LRHAIPSLVPKLHRGTPLSAQFHCRRMAGLRAPPHGRQSRADKCVPRWSRGTRGQTRGQPKEEGRKSAPEPAPRYFLRMRPSGGPRESCCRPRESCCGLREPCCGLREPCCGPREPCCELREPCCGPREPCCGPRESCCGPRESCCGPRESCCGPWESCCGPREPCCKCMHTTGDQSLTTEIPKNRYDRARPSRSPPSRR